MILLKQWNRAETFHSFLKIEMEAERVASCLKKTQELIELANSGKILYTNLWKNMVRLMSVAINGSIQEGVT